MPTTKNTDCQFNYEVNRDLVCYFDENRVETIYTQPGTNTKTRHHILVADLSTEKLWIKRVLICKLYGESKLLIVCGDSTNKIYFFWHCVITKSSKAIDFEASVVGDITQAKMTKVPFEVDYVYKAKAPEKKMCFALVLGMQDGSSVLFLLNINQLSSIRVSFKYLDKEEGNDVGHVTSIYILPQDTNDKRMGHHDPQILLGYSKGAIRAYRFRATVYSHKASRIGLPIDLSEFTEFPGYPITHLSCARTYNSLKLIVSFAQEKPNEAEFENTQAYVKLIEFNGTKKSMLKLFHPPIQSASIAEVHLMLHYEDSIDFTIIFYSSLLRTFTISVWYLDNKQIMKHTLEKEITQSSCLERLEPTERTEPDDSYLLKNPEKIIELAFSSQTVGLKRKAALDFFKENLEALELPNKRKKHLHKNTERAEPDNHYLFRNLEQVIEATFPSQAVGLKRKATVDIYKEGLEGLEFPNKRQKISHDNSPLNDDDENDDDENDENDDNQNDDDEAGISKNEKGELKEGGMEKERAQDVDKTVESASVSQDDNEMLDENDSGRQDEDIEYADLIEGEIEENDQMEEDYDVYYDAEEGCDEMENVEEDCVDCSDEEVYVDCPGEEYYVDCPDEEENFPTSYDDDHNECSSATEEDNDEQTIEPQEGVINLIYSSDEEQNGFINLNSDSEDKEMDMDLDMDENSSVQLLGVSDREKVETGSIFGSVEGNESSSVQLLGVSDREKAETGSGFGSVEGNENTFVEGIVKQRPSLAELAASYKWDHYEWGK